MKDKTVLITGATSGIGKAVALNLAKRGARLIMVGRDRDRAESARYEILRFSDNNDIHLFFADLSLIEETKNFARSVKNVFPRIDVLVNNAAVLAHKNKTLTKENFEITIATNLLSPFILTLELLDTLINSPNSQVICVSSWMHRAIRVNWNNLNSNLRYTSMQAYGTSKLLLTTLFFCLANKLSPEELNINCVDPGVVYTEIGRNYSSFYKLMYSLGEPFMRPAVKGAESIIKLASEKENYDFHGAYVKDLKNIKASKFCYRKHNQKRIWKEILSITGYEDPFINK